MSNQLSTTDQADFKKLKASAIEHWNGMADHYQKSSEDLLAIKKRELWRVEGHKNWTSFLDHMGEKMDKSPRRLFQMVRAAETKSKLLKDLQQKSPDLRKIAEKITPEAYLEVAKAPEDQRLKVLESVAKDGRITAPAVAAAVKVASKVHTAKEQKSTDKSTWPKDVNETPIPPPAWPFWERRDEVQPWLSQISGIKCSIEKALKEGDALFAWIGNPAVDFLSSSYAAISNAKLYAVCTKCEGWWDRMTGGGCSTCHNTGLLSKHQYDVCSPKEIKDIREKANRARA